MEPKDIEREAYRAAKERVEERIGFFWHFISYVAINAVIVFIWYYTSGSDSYFWPAWPIFGWGIGLFFHFAGVFFARGLFQNYREKKMRQYMEEEKRRIENKYHNNEA